MRLLESHVQSLLGRDDQDGTVPIGHAYGQRFLGGQSIRVVVGVVFEPGADRPRRLFGALVEILLNRRQDGRRGFLGFVRRSVLQGQRRIARPVICPWHGSAAFVDFDRDGWLDLVVVNYVAYDPTRACFTAEQPDLYGRALAILSEAFVHARSSSSS